MYLNWSICLIKVAQHQECRFGDLTKANYCQRWGVGCCRQASHKPPAAGNSCLLKWLKRHINYLGKFELQTCVLWLALVPSCLACSQAALSPSGRTRPTTTSPTATHHARTPSPAPADSKANMQQLLSRFIPVLSHFIWFYPIFLHPSVRVPRPTQFTSEAPALSFHVSQRGVD